MAQLRYYYTPIWASGTLQDAKSSDVQLRVQCGHQIINLLPGLSQQYSF
jgi:hypothetical protein